MSVFRVSVVALLALLAASPVALSQDRPGRPAQTKPDDAPHGPGVLRLLPADATSDKDITLGGRKLGYTATAGTLSLFDQSGDKSAAVFYTAYVAKDADANTAFSQSVLPLPFHSMSRYPYPANEHFPTDVDHTQYQREYNTRPALHLLRPLVGQVGNLRRVGNPPVGTSSPVTP